MLKKPFLMIPGPTNVPERVLQAMHRPLINHRGPEYEVMFQRISLDIRKIFQTKQPVLIYPAAGTGMMEAAIVNILSPGDKVLALSIGVFGNRLAEIAEKFGAKVEKLEFTWGHQADPALVAQKLAEDKNHEIKAVLMTHNETSTGVTNNIQALAAACSGHPALRVVDAVSSLGAVELKMDEWHLDVVFTGAQKALMLPPGLGFLALSEKAWQAQAASTMPKYYWDAALLKKSLVKWQNPYTPPVTLLFGLAESLTMIEEEGLSAVFHRHQLIGEAVRAAMEALGLGLFADKAGASDTVTSVLVPEGFDVKKIQQHMRDVYGIVLAGGQKQLENKIFRIGHLGYITPSDVLLTISALELTLAALGKEGLQGKGVKAAQDVFLAELSKQ
jgi:aspartate aminotransferase-like enzyme